MKLPKFYIGPMTQNVIDAIIESVKYDNMSFGFIPSRRQVEWYDGYTGYNTADFISYVRSKCENIIIERDHSGVGQGDTFDTPIYFDLKSMIHDAHNHIDIIHIDPWKKLKNYDAGLRETSNNILYVYQKNPKVLFEVGTEEAIYPYTDYELYKLLKDLKYELGEQIFKNIKYAVIQSGTRLEATKNIGKFDSERLTHMIEACESFNILSKEHNGDYLTNEEIKMRFDNGLDAINIAPEFGVIETKVLLDNIKNKEDFEKIYDICINGGNWKKWIPEIYHVKRHLDDESKRHLIEICGHYHNKEIKQIVNIDDEIIKTVLKNRLKELNELI